MIIKKAILHILDFNSDVCVFSQKELDITDYGTGEFIEKHLTKIVEDSAKKEGEFLEYSVFKQSLERYVSGGSDFTEFPLGRELCSTTRFPRLTNRSPWTSSSVSSPMRTTNT